MKLPFCRTALLAAALGACLVGCKPAATDEPAAFATAETAEVAATLTPTAATTAQPVAAEIGTVLPATEDAGRSYLDETLFIGDSNTVRYTMYADETGTAFASVDNSIGVVSMGAGAITTLKCEKFKGSSAMYTVPDAVAMLKPQRIIICYGTNNLGGSSTTRPATSRPICRACRPSRLRGPTAISSSVPSRRWTNSARTPT